MYPEERMQVIYEKVKKNGKIDVDEITNEFGISKSTARSDLTELAARGLVKRTHGGAIAVTEQKMEEKVDLINVNFRVDERIVRNAKEKEAIGKLAASMIKDGETIMIDGGSTTMCVSKYFGSERKLTIITNSYLILESLLPYNNLTVYMAGGLVYKENAIMIGDFTNDFCRNFRTDKVIIGIDGLSIENGLTVADSNMPAVASIKRKMLESGVKKIVVCDHTKFERVCLLPIAAINKIDCIITDSKVSRDMVQAVREKGVEVLIAEVEEEAYS